MDPGKLAWTLIVLALAQALGADDGAGARAFIIAIQKPLRAERIL
ncbi:MAG TPA: hypothetical protein VGW77_05995 [Candidatus Binatia bacterium]|nr:hypothetical protein [Candidatus Binatia bacterium]